MPSVTDILAKCLRLIICCFYNQNKYKYESNLDTPGEISLCVGSNSKPKSTYQRRCVPKAQTSTRNYNNNNDIAVNESPRRSKQDSSVTSNPHHWQLFNTNEFCSIKYGDRIQFHDQSLSNIMRMIKRAVDKDKLRPINQSVKYTSSAADTITMFSQIKEETYKHINLQDIGKDTKLIATIIDEYCRCCAHYVDEIFKKMDLLAAIEFDSRKFKISEQWCYGINSASFINASLYPFVNQMELDEITGSSSTIELWKSNLMNTTEKTYDEIEGKISYQLEMAAKKMTSAVNKRWFKCLSNTQFDHQKINEYIASNFLTGTKLLDNKSFDLLLQFFWSNMLTIIPICMNESKTDSAQFMHEFTQGLKTLMSIIDERHVLELNTIDKWIKMLEAGTNEYIHHYYLTRLTFQKTLTDNSFGLITVKAHFSRNDLSLEILSARNIVPSGKTGTSKCYIKINFLPKHEFKNIPIIKTRIHERTECLIFNEIHSVCLSPKQYSIKNALLQFTFKKRHCLNVKNKFMSESFMLLNDISRCESSNCLCKTEQIHLILSRPTSLQCYPCHILKQISDKKALKFLKKENKKIEINGE